MPRATLPLTPASSTDLQGQDGSKNLASLQLSFELPPPAINNPAKVMVDTKSRSPPTASDSCGPGGVKSAYPLQASETVKSRRRPSAATTAAKDSFALPPPPTRSRKIIQMKPRPQEEAEAQVAATGAKGGAKLATATASSPPTTSSPVGKKKQPSATSVAGRKIARKTAHSLIERRRRSKMNDEFATLKNMVPACTGEMHKLAILQASIEYVRYLEDCVSKLQAEREGAQPATPTELAPPPSLSMSYDQTAYPDQDPYESPDVEMTDTELPSPASAAGNPPHGIPPPLPQPSRSKQSSISPALLAEDSRRRTNSYSSSASTTGAVEGRHYSFASSTTSPAFGPQSSSYAAAGGYSHPGSTLTSPALAPQRDLDHEATAALLMLNSDRRGTFTGSTSSAGPSTASNSARGMSVRDLLST